MSRPTGTYTLAHVNDIEVVIPFLDGDHKR
jgi:hypothetical protein